MPIKYLEKNCFNQKKLNDVVKLGGNTLINEESENLIKLQKKINTEKINNPSFLMILTATGKYAFKREDGVYVVPIGCLKD